MTREISFPPSIEQKNNSWINWGFSLATHASRTTFQYGRWLLQYERAQVHQEYQLARDTLPPNELKTAEFIMGVAQGIGAAVMISSDSPEFERANTTSFLVIIPISPCLASLG